MCVRCDERAKALASQAVWLESFGLNPYAYYDYQQSYLSGLVCPEAEGSVPDGPAGDIAGNTEDAGDSEAARTADVQPDPREVGGTDRTTTRRRDDASPSRSEEDAR